MLWATLPTLWFKRSWRSIIGETNRKVIKTLIVYAIRKPLQIAAKMIRKVPPQIKSPLIDLILLFEQHRENDKKKAKKVIQYI